MSPSKYLSRNRVPGRSAPLAATTTKLNITSNTSELPTANSGPKDQALTATDGASDGKGRQVTATNDASIENPSPGTKTNQDAKLKGSHDSRGDMNDKSISAAKPADTFSGWLSWFSSQVNPVPQQVDSEQTIPVKDHGGNTLVFPTREISLDPKVEELSPNQKGNSEPDVHGKGSESASQPRSWLGFWGSNSALPAEESKIEATAETPGETFQDDPEAKVKEIVKVPVQDSKPTSSLSETEAGPSQVPRSTGWAFWSRENANSETSGSNHDVGRLAVANSPSQSQPESAVVNEDKGIPIKIGKIEKSTLQEVAEDKTTSRASNGEIEVVRKANAASPELTSKPTARKQAKNVPSNLILPSFRRTYREIDKPSLFQQVGRLLQYNRIPDTRCVGIRYDPPRINKAIAIVSHAHALIGIVAP